MTPRATPARSLALSLVLLASAGCTGEKGGGRGVVLPSVPTYAEIELNDTPATANFFGAVGVGDHFAITGKVSDVYGDWFDGFAFYALEDVDVQFVLTIHNTFADLDVCWYEPIGGAHVTCWETGHNPEIGLLPLYAGEDFHLVVSPFVGTSTYTLEVIGHAIGYASVAAPVASAVEPAKGPRAVPFEEYRDAPEPPAEEAPLARGRVLSIDGEGGGIRSREVEVHSEGIRIGPIVFGAR